MRAFLCLDFVLGFCVRRKIAGSLEPGAGSTSHLVADRGPCNREPCVNGRCFIVCEKR